MQMTEGSLLNHGNSSVVSHSPPYEQLDATVTPIPDNMVVSTSPPTPSLVVPQSRIKPNSYLGPAIVITICSNPLFGLIAIAFSVMSEKAYKKGNIEQARKHGRTSMIILAIAIPLALVADIVFAVWFFQSKPFHDILNWFCHICVNIYQCTDCTE